MNKHHPVRFLVVHPDSIETAVKACEKSGLSTKMIVLIRSPCASSSSSRPAPWADSLTTGPCSRLSRQRQVARERIPDARRPRVLDERRADAAQVLAQAGRGQDPARLPLVLVRHDRRPKGRHDPALRRHQQRVRPLARPVLEKVQLILLFSLCSLQDALHWSKSNNFVPYDAKTKKGDVVMGCLPLCVPSSPSEVLARA